MPVSVGHWSMPVTQFCFFWGRDFWNVRVPFRTCVDECWLVSFLWLLRVSASASVTLSLLSLLLLLYRIGILYYYRSFVIFHIMDYCVYHARVMWHCYYHSWSITIITTTTTISLSYLLPDYCRQGIVIWCVLFSFVYGNVPAVSCNYYAPSSVRCRHMPALRTMEYWGGVLRELCTIRGFLCDN